MRGALTAQAARLACVLAIALAAAFAGCGDTDDDDGSGRSSDAPAARSEPAGGAAGRNAGEPGEKAGTGRGEADSGGGSAGSDGEVAGGRDEVDLSVDPGSIRGARVTPAGAVQTLPPDEGAHRTAQANGYPSINSFGEEAAGEEATSITFALVQYLTARADGDWATACARLYGVLRESVESNADGRPCPEAFAEMTSRAPREALAEQALIDVSSVRRGDGNRAFVIYRTPGTLSADMPMYVEDGIWKVGALEAYALSPGEAE